MNCTIAYVEYFQPYLRPNKSEPLMRENNEDHDKGAINLKRTNFVKYGISGEVSNELVFLICCVHLRN